MENNNAFFVGVVIGALTMGISLAIWLPSPEVISSKPLIPQKTIKVETKEDKIIKIDTIYTYSNTVK